MYRLRMGDKIIKDGIRSEACARIMARERSGNVEIVVYHHSRIEEMEIAVFRDGKEIDKNQLHPRATHSIVANSKKEGKS